MATTVDQKVVQMKFDNRDFEQNVKVSMSTLDKLKAKLHLDGASKGLENVSAAARKVNMDGLADGIQTVSAKFSAMEVIGVTALANITNSAVTAGLQLAKSLTVDQVSSGWNKMNQKIGSVQTLVNSTGLSVEEIDEYLSQLMWYSDETSYSFTDMTASLAQMTATGGDIKKLVPMIRGIANATAYAGKGAAEFSRVIYNLNQSYGAGYLQLMDWKSVQLAGANSKQLTEELIKAGEELGTIQKGQVTIGNFNESLKDKWATTEVMEKAFARFDQLSAAAYDAVQNGVKLADGSIKTFDTCAEAIEYLSGNYDDLAVAAFRSAQEAKSFKEAIDATADATSSAWMEIFTAVFGGYNEQKRIFTDLANWLYDVFVNPLYKIEEVVRNAFDFSGFENMWNKITDNSLVKTMEKVSDSIKTTTRTLEEYQDIVTKVWRGDFNNRGDNPDRFDLLSQAGWDPKVVQELVNQTDRMAGYGKGWTVIGELTIDDVRKAEEKYGVAVKDTTKEVSKQADVTEDLNKKLQNLSEEQLKEMGLSDEEVRMYQSLQRASKKYGKSMDEIIKKMSEMSGRDLVFGKGAVDDADHVPGIFQNIAGALGNVASAAKTAWAETFKPFGGAELYMIINNLWEFTNRLKEASSQEKFVRNLTDVFKGLFSILKLVTTIMGGGFKIAWTIFSTVCQTLGYDVLDVAGAIGNLTSKIVNFITENEFIIKGVVWLTQTIAGAIVKFHDWITSFVSLNGILHTFQDVLAKAKEGFSDWLKGLKEQKGIGNIAKYIFEGLINGIKTYGGKALSAIWDFGTQLIATIKEKLGIHSPSTVFFAIGGFLIAGLIAGITSQQLSLFDILKGIGNKIIDIFKNIDLTDLFIMASSAGLIYGFVNISKAMKIFADGLQNLNGILSSANGVLKAFRGVLLSFKIKIITASIKDVAVSIAILVASIWVLTTMDITKMWIAVGAIASLAGILLAFGAVASLFKKIGGDFGKIALMILSIGLVFKMMASTVKSMSEVEPGKLQTGIDALSQFVELIAILMLTASLMSGSKNVDKIGKTLLKIAAVFLIMAIVVKSLGKMDIRVLTQGTTFLTLFTGIIVGLFASTKLITGSNNVDKIGKSLLKIGIVFLLMAQTVKILGKMDPGTLMQGTIFLTLFGSMIVGLMAATKLITGSSNVDKIGGMIAKIGASFLLMAIAVKMLGSMKLTEVALGTTIIAAFVGMIIGIITFTKQYKGQVAGVGTMMFGIGVALLAMSLAVGFLGMIKLEDLVKGITAVGLLLLFMKGLIEATKDARNVFKLVLSFSAMIAVLALAIGLLSIIDPKKLAGPTLALSSLIGMSALLVKATEGFSKGGNQKEMLKNVGIMLGVIGVLAGIVYGLSLIKNPEGALQTCIAVGVLGVALSAMLQVISNVKIDVKSLGTSLLGLAGLLVTLLGVVGILALMQGIQNAAANTVVLTSFMAAMTLCLIGIAAAGAIYAVSGGMALLGLVGLAGILVALLGVVGILALMNAVPNAAANTLLLTSFMSIMCGMLTQLAIVGPLALVGVAALTGLMTLMPILILFATAIGALVTYIPALQEFMNTGMQVMISLAGGLGEMIGAFVNGVLTQISAGLPQIGKDLSAFVTAAMPFIVGIKMADGNTLKGVGIITASVLALTVAELINGIGKLLTMGGGLKQLGKDLSAFMVAALPFLTIASTLNANMMKGVESLAKAVLTLTAAELIQGIVNFVTGGGSSLQEFGAQLPGLGTNLAGFVTNLGTFTDEQANTVKCAGDAIVNLAEAAKKLPSEGGWIAAICGDNSLATFGESLPDIGTEIKEFVENLGVFTDDQVKTAKCASEVIVALAEAAKKIPNEGGLWAKIAGDNSLADFAGKLPDVASGIKGFVDKLGNFGNKTESAKAAAEIIKGIANLADKGANKDKGKQLTEFANELPPFAEKLKTFITTMSSLSKESTETAADNTKVIVDAANNMMKTIKDNITAKSTDIVTASEEVGKKSADGFNSQAVKDKLKNQAYNFVKGFADGVTTNSNLAEEAARQVAQKALDASQKKLDEHSPSKETLQQGQYFGEGFVIGLKQYSSRVYSMSGQMADEAKKGLANALTNISSLVESDIDTNPTIRPVLDLSEVSDGASRIGSMLNGNRVGVSANLNSISSGMNARSQNGNNSDVVSAINKLGKNIDNRPGNTYNINGINTNGDTAIENAVNTLIRAIEVERRV